MDQGRMPLTLEESVAFCARARAKELLTYYFRLIAGKTGIHWDAHNDAEVEAIVDEIIDAAKAEVAEQYSREFSALRSLVTTSRLQDQEDRCE